MSHRLSGPRLATRTVALRMPQVDEIRGDYPEVAKEIEDAFSDLQRQLEGIVIDMVDALNWQGATRVREEIAIRFDSSRERWLSGARLMLQGGYVGAAPASGYLDVGGVPSSATLGWRANRAGTIVRWSGQWTGSGPAGAKLEIRSSGTLLHDVDAAGQTGFSEDVTIDFEAGDVIAFGIASNTASVMTDINLAAEVAWREEGVHD